MTQIEGKELQPGADAQCARRRQALLAAFDPAAQAQRTRAGDRHDQHRSAPKPRAYWGAYGATKAAFDALLTSYARSKSENISATRVAIARSRRHAARRCVRAPTRARIRRRSSRSEAVAERLVALLAGDFA